TTLNRATPIQLPSHSENHHRQRPSEAEASHESAGVFPRLSGRDEAAGQDGENLAFASKPLTAPRRYLLDVFITIARDAMNDQRCRLWRMMGRDGSCRTQAGRSGHCACLEIN
ncbi:MAG TPA: hypothetical protein VF184_05340, partial [Phycisphaeraceae bacterium]